MSIACERNLDEYIKTAIEKYGEHRWVYHVSMWRDTVLFSVVIKAAFTAFFAAFAVSALFLALEGRYESIPYAFYISCRFLAFLLSVEIISYLVTALVYRGSYTVSYELNETCIEYRQIQKSKKASKLSANKNVKTVFVSVRKIVVYEKRKVIRLKTFLTRNYIYVKNEDFSYVKSFIFEKCCNNPRLKIKVK